MCTDCKTSKLGQRRQVELDAAVLACEELNLNIATAGFLAKYRMPDTSIPRRYRTGTIQFTDKEKAALDRYNAASEAMKKLHEDYLFSQTCKENLRILRHKATIATGVDLAKINVRIAYEAQYKNGE